jgi:hypothetical protein
MDHTDTKRKFVNKQQTDLRKIITSFTQYEKSIELFCRQHAMLHSAKMAQMDLWSFEDAILDDMTENQIRRIPQNCEHSVAWCIWHIARIEDVAMNMVVAGTPQIFSQDDWPVQMKVTFRDAGNDMTEAEIRSLSTIIDIEALRAYRAAVGRRTRQIVQALQPEDLKKRADPQRIQRVMEEGALAEASRGIAEYWSKRDITGLLLMPASRHQIVHLNEALNLKKKRQ